MTRTADIQNLKERLGGAGGPVLSIYLDVNAARPENQGQAYLTRLKEKLGETEEAPEDLKQRVFDALEGEQPGGRTLVVFAGEDGLFEWHATQVGIPESVSYGEPRLAPLALAMDENERYGFVVVDAEEFRFFVNSPVADPAEAGGEDVSGFYEEADLDPSEPSPRGGAEHDAQSRRKEENISRFFDGLGETTRDLAFREGVKHLILAGPKERTSEFRERLPKEIQGYVAGETHVQRGAPDGEVLSRLEDARRRAERERKNSLVEEIRERGVRGVKDTIEALQEGRVYHVVALWDLDAEVRWSDAEGLVITDVTSKESPFTGEETRPRLLSDVLVDLAAARGARLEFVRSEDEVAQTPNEDAEREHPQNDAARVLLEEFDGLAGRLRY